MRLRALPLQLAFIALAVCPLAAGCVGAAIEPAPVSAATALDAEPALSVELAYQATVLALLAQDAAGMFKVDRTEFRQRDQAAFAAVRRVRAALMSGDAKRYRASLREANTAIAELGLL